MKAEESGRMQAVIAVAILLLALLTCGFGYWATQVERGMRAEHERLLRATLEARTEGELDVDALVEDLKDHGFRASRDGDELQVRTPDDVVYAIDLGAKNPASSLKLQNRSKE